MNEAEELIYQILCDIESDIENKLTIENIYKKLSEYSMKNINKVGSDIE